VRLSDRGDRGTDDARVVPKLSRDDGGAHVVSSMNRSWRLLAPPPRMMRSGENTRSMCSK
jgi:hypothetical protein